MKKNRILTAIIALTICASCFAMLPTEVNAAQESDLRFKVENGEAILIDCDEDASGELIIPATVSGYPVTRIDDNAFRECKYLTLLVIPEGVTSIGKRAFRYTHIENITLPASLISIEQDALNEDYGDFNHILYNGTREQWGQIYIHSSNSGLNCIRHYNCDGDEFVNGTCLICNGKCPHKWNEGIITKRPTSTEEGTKTFTCLKCYKTRTETVKKERLKTDDTAGGIPWWTLLLAGGGCAAVAVIVVKKKS